MERGRLLSLHAQTQKKDQEKLKILTDFQLRGKPLGEWYDETQGIRRGKVGLSRLQVQEIVRLKEKEKLNWKTIAEKMGLEERRIRNAYFRRPR